MKKTVFICMFALVMMMVSFAYGFSDVNDNDWFYENVTEMTGNGYLSGYEDGSFRPAGIITKAELVSVICRVNAIKEKKARNAHWSGGMMTAALDAGYYDWDEIPPSGEAYDEPITRQLAVKIVMKAFLPDIKGDYNAVSQTVKDFSQLDGRYYDSVIAAYCNGIVFGDNEGNINPKAYMTRAEACAIIMRAANKKGDLKPYEKPVASETPVTPSKSGVNVNGKLRVEDNKLVNDKGESVVLHGMSSHGLQWFSSFTAEEAIKATADYGANLFRCAMYTDEGGYISNASMKDTLISAVDNAVKHDMYVIIDWHILSDGNPLLYVDEAEKFFAEMSFLLGMT